ncbi:MAG: helix-turn-helix transcriptional regulator [Spirochaetaceae bacterium]|nr:helix-turn-helix transcriptional regulator [Spirochaetaceae bacterium]
MGTIICEARKNKNMTQADLAQIMNVTDKAVSKWERDISCPDVTSLAKLSETLGITLEELMSGQPADKKQKQIDLVELVCIAVSFAMGIAVLILSVLSKLELETVPVKTENLIIMLSVGLVTTGFSKLRSIEK